MAEDLTVKTEPPECSNSSTDEVSNRFDNDMLDCLENTLDSEINSLMLSSGSIETPSTSDLNTDLEIKKEVDDIKEEEDEEVDITSISFTDEMLSYLGGNADTLLTPTLEIQNPSDFELLVPQRKRKRREHETSEQREKRLATAREYVRRKRKFEPIEKRLERLRKHREYIRRVRAESKNKPELNTYYPSLSQNAIRQQLYREKETPEQREHRLAAAREYVNRRRKNESPEERQERLAKQRKRQQICREQRRLNAELHAIQKHEDAEKKKATRALETPEQRETRLTRDRERHRIKREQLRLNSQLYEMHKLEQAYKKKIQRSLKTCDNIPIVITKPYDSPTSEQREKRLAYVRDCQRFKLNQLKLDAELEALSKLEATAQARMRRANESAAQRQKRLDLDEKDRFIDPVH